MGVELVANGNGAPTKERTARGQGIVHLADFDNAQVLVQLKETKAGQQAQLGNCSRKKCWSSAPCLAASSGWQVCSQLALQAGVQQGMQSKLSSAP